MAEELLYLDSSALVKLVHTEAETPVLSEFLRDWPFRISSRLAQLEVVRAARRLSVAEDLTPRAQAVLTRIHLLNLDNSILEQASLLGPSGLRSLDAIHLASALFLGSAIGGFVAYDHQLAAAARQVGLRVFAPA